MIQLLDVSKTFESKAGKVHALKHVNMTIEEGDVFGVIGFSGAGKSTLIRLVNGLEKPTNGRVFVKGQEMGELPKSHLRKMRKEIGMVFQQFNLLNAKTVYANVAMPLVLDKIPKQDIQKRVMRLLEYVGLEDKADAYPNELSGGQKQRVGIARALATNPSILLCDEATSALDPKTTLSILELLKKINQELNITILIITHEMNVIKNICNKVAVMEDGAVIEEGKVIDVFGNPQKEVTKDFVKTVIDDTLPEGMMKKLKRDRSNSSILRLKTIGDYGKNALLSEINKEFDITTHILFASVSELRENTLSIVIVEIEGTPIERERALAHIQSKGILYERMEL